ncbi:response regulator transcription factor [Streptosporangium lutulentum]|uniref:DNA-binding NarL/FixJ family response regulator n=1 Tax=Streptosporangium lutulentum TaxID=1461250 RepID=A0ABT9Q5B9_9ACTN|nr:response regulator transcription factor [Streptosporangium lutulentum]MDP9841936.1 DNA-binding NarL/FixJ family response regulator [Streptosporangium lutulentum]
MGHTGHAAAPGEVIRVVVADDEKLIRSGWSTMLSMHPDIEVVGEASDGREAVALGIGAGVVLMDIRMPYMDGLTATRELSRRSPGTRVIVVTTFENDQLVWGALRAGAAGYLLKRAPANELVDAIRLVHGREAVLFPDALRRIAAPRQGTTTSRSSLDLTPRELAVLRQIARGQNNAEIAATLFVSRETVKTHVRNVLDKLDARDRTQAVVRAYELGIVFAGVELP